MSIELKMNENSGEFIVVDFVGLCWPHLDKPLSRMSISKLPDKLIL